MQRKIRDIGCGRMKKAGLAVCLLLLLGCMLVSCDSKREEKRTSITILHGYGGESERDAKIREIYKEFERVNPDVSINLISVPGFNHVEAKTKELLAVGKVPNIVYAGGYSMDAFYHFMLQEEYLLDLMPYIREDEEFAKNISKKNIEEWKTGESIFTITDNFSLRGYWYNKKIFKNAQIETLPQTKEEFETVCRQISAWAKREKLNTVALTIDPEAAADIVQYFIDGDLEEMDFPLGVNRSKFLQALQKLRQLNELNKEERVYSKKDSFASFNVGHSAIYFGEFWEREMFTKTLDAGFAFFSDETGTKPMYSALSGYLISNLAEDAQKNASIRFLKYMLTKEVQSELSDIGMIPSNPSVEFQFFGADEQVMDERNVKLLESDRYVLAPQKTWKGVHYMIFLEKISLYLQGEVNGYQLMKMMRE